MKKTYNGDESKARINILHLNDCTRRIELMRDMEASDQIPGLEEQQRELQTRLQQNKYFQSLPSSTKTRCLQGKNLTIESRDDGLAELGFSKGAFDSIFDLLSQHTHILPLSFYRMEPNGRGTGVENNTDRGYIAFTLGMCSGLIKSATDKMVAQFPDTADVRRGVDSKFSPGPASNRPVPKASNSSHQANLSELARTKDRIAEAIVKVWPDSSTFVVGNSIAVHTDTMPLACARLDK
jgi:hypothetical protein